MASPRIVLMLFGRGRPSLVVIGRGHIMLAHHLAAWASAIFHVLTHFHPALGRGGGVRPRIGCRRRGMVMLSPPSALRMSIRLGVSGGGKGQQ
jgi:hypothetical protein